MVNTNQNERITLPEDTPSILLKILEENNLKESSEEFWKKFELKKQPRQIILGNIARDFARKIITEDKLTPTIKEKLETTDEIAKKIATDIQAKIISRLENINQLNTVAPKKQSLPKAVKNSNGAIKKKTGPDTYREPIE